VGWELSAESSPGAPSLLGRIGRCNPPALSQALRCGFYPAWRDSMKMAAASQVEGGRSVRDAAALEFEHCSRLTAKVPIAVSLRAG